MKTKHIAAMAAAIAVCTGTALYMPQDKFVSGVLTASAAETVNSNSTMKVHTEDEEAFVFHVNDSVDFENKEFYEQNLVKINDVSILIYDENGENPNFKYRLHTDYERFSFDMSEVNMAKAGTYPVYVTAKEDSAIRTSFNITVKEWFMKVHTEDEEAFVFHVNDSVDFENEEFYEQNHGKLDDVSILIYDEDGRKPYLDQNLILRYDYDLFSFDMSEVNMAKAGTYPVYVTAKDDASIRTSFNITVKDWFMKVHAEDENAFVFHVNDFVDFENKEFYEQNHGKLDDVSILIYDEDGRKPYLDQNLILRYDYDLFSFDMSEVNMAKAGTYPVYVIDKKDSAIRTSFNITVKDWFMKVHAEDENAFVFHVNDFVDFENKEFYEQNHGKLDDVSILIYDEDGRKPYLDQNLILRYNYDLFSFDMSEVNMAKAGTYPVYVTAKDDASIRTSFNITVKDWFIKVHTEDENAFVFHVNDFVDFENKEFYEQNHGKLDDVSILVYDEDGRKPYPNQNLTLPNHYNLFSFDMSEVNMKKAGTYPVYVTAKEGVPIRTSFEIKVVAWEMEVIGDSEKDFIFHIDDVIFDGENTAYANYHVNIFDSYGNKLIYGEYTYESYLNTTDYEIDLSKVNMSKPGTYPVTVIYKENESIRCKFDIHVKNLYMEVLKNNEEDFIYYVGESFNKLRYDVKIYDDDKVIHSSWPLYFDAIIDTSEVDMNTPGTYTVYATHEYHPSVKCEFEITVKEKGEPVTKVYSNRADEFTFNVGDELCLDEFYIMRTSASGNVSIIVYFEQCTVDTSEVDMNTPGTYTIYVSNDTSSISTEFQITVESIESTTTATTTTTTTTTATTTTTTTTTTVTTENETPETTTTVTTLPQTGYSSLYNYMMLLAAAITTFGGYVMAKARKKFNNN